MTEGVTREGASATGDARNAAFDALDALAIVKRRFGQGDANYDELVAAAEAYRTAIIERKASEPTRFRRLCVPSVAQLLR